MEQMIINAVGTLAFGGGGIGIVAFIYHKQFLALITTHKEEIDRICLSFEKSLSNRDDQIRKFIDSALLSGEMEKDGSR